MNYLSNLFTQKTLESVLKGLNVVLTQLQRIAKTAADEAEVLEGQLEKARSTALQAGLVAKNIQTLLTNEIKV